MSVVAGQSHQDACGTAALLLATQTAVTHPSADWTAPGLHRECTNLAQVMEDKEKIFKNSKSLKSLVSQQIYCRHIYLYLYNAGFFLP